MDWQATCAERRFELKETLQRRRSGGENEERWKFGLVTLSPALSPKPSAGHEYFQSCIIRVFSNNTLYSLIILQLYCTVESDALFGLMERV